MTYKGVIGVFDIDKRVDIYSVTDIAEVVRTVNLRSVFYAMNMLDGNPLIAEIHQADPMMNVDVVVGKTEEAIACVNMFNKNISAYLMFNFPIKGVGKEFIKRLLRVSVDPEIIKGIGDCTWDKKTRVLTTPKDIEDSGKNKLEDAAWYQKDYGVKNSNGSKKYNKEEKLLAPENIYTLVDDHTYTTLNERP